MSHRDKDDDRTMRASRPARGPGKNEDKDKNENEQDATTGNTAHEHTHVHTHVHTNECECECECEYEDAPINQGLLSGKRKTIHPHYQHGRILDPAEWTRPYWLGAVLFLILFAFWLLDSLKDPIFVRLVDGKLGRHQPPAKLCSVFVTLSLVCFLELWTNHRQQRKREARIRRENEVTPDESVLDPGGVWKRIRIKSSALSSSMSMSMSMSMSNDYSEGKTDNENENENDNDNELPEQALDDIVSFDIFYCIGVPYLLAFSVLSYFVWRFEQNEYRKTIIKTAAATVSTTTTTSTSTSTLTPLGGGGAMRKLPDPTTISAEYSSNNNSNSNSNNNYTDDGDGENPTGYYVLGYILYATVESFGSLAVATFWSYTNSTLSLRDAERYYGPIVATAQLGAIGGSTLVATGRWEASALLTVVALAIVLQLLLIRGYDRRFEPTSILVVEQQQQQHQHQHQQHQNDLVFGGSRTQRSTSGHGTNDDGTRSVLTLQDGNATLTKPFWSGLYLIFSHSYVLLILGVSCLYEVAMTLLDYQMKLLGFAKFHDDDVGTAAGVGIGVDGTVADTDTDTDMYTDTDTDMDMDTHGYTHAYTSSRTDHTSSMSFATFMGHYGQVVNVTSLVFSSLLFPFLIRKLGLRRTLLWFPTMLLVVTFLAYGVLPGNLTVLFVSLSLLKAMTYSVHDPSKELLYIPTSNAVKFRAKFWIDVVGERISKAVGSAFNALAKNVEQSVRIGTVPSLLTALGLWMACYCVGWRFDELLASGKIVGLEHSIDPSTYSRVPNNDDGDGDDTDDDFYDRNCTHEYSQRDDNDDDDDDEPSEVEISFLEEDAISTLDLMADPTTAAISSSRRKKGGSEEDDAIIIRGIELSPLFRI